MFYNPLWIDKLKQILIGRQSRWAVMECKTYAVHARNTRAVGTSAKKHIPEPKTNTGARSVERRPPLILCHTPSWTRRDCREIEADSSSCPFPEISYLDALSLMMAPRYKLVCNASWMVSLAGWKALVSFGHHEGGTCNQSSARWQGRTWLVNVHRAECSVEEGKSSNLFHTKVEFWSSVSD